MSKMTDRSCVDFAAVLAAKESVPGGGGAAALVGALGVALCSMVGNFTLGKKKYADVEDDVKAMLEKGEELRLQLLGLVEADAEAFEPLSKAYGIPKDDPERADKLEEATKNAVKAPVDMVIACGEAVELLAEMQKKGSVMLISDVGCGASLCKAAMESAAMNVYINTKSLMDRQLADELEGKVDECLSKYIPMAERIVKEVTDGIRS